MTVSFKVNRSGKSKVLSQEERNLIQTHLPEKYRLISEVLYWSAGRIREVLNIRVRNLVPDQGMVVLEKETTKTKETREVFVPDHLMRQLLLRVRSLRLAPSDFLFFNQSPTQSSSGGQRPLTVQSFDKELRRVCDWNGLSGVSSHSFRRTQLTELYRDGWSLREIQHISGHKSLQSLQEYLDVDKEKVVDKFRSRMEVVPMTYTARVVYNLNSPFGYSRYNWTMSISGSHAGQTESAVMHKLKDRHGWDADITILSIDWR